MNYTEIWRHWEKVLPDYFEKYTYTDLGFLKEVLEVEPDRYGGINRIFYYKDGCFYTAIEHWDGRNMWANVTCDRIPLTKEAFAEVLDSKKAHILAELSESEKSEFEHIFSEVKHFLLRQLDQDK